MPRKPSIWPRAGTDWWYTTFEGQQVRLSQDKKEAERLFHELHSKPKETRPLEQRGATVAVVSPTFRKLADMFLEESERENAPQTFKNHKRYLKSFSDHVGKNKRASELKAHHVTEWLQKHPKWSEGTRVSVRSHVLSCLNWAVEQGYLTVSPLKKLKRGVGKRSDRILTPEEKTKIFEVCPKYALDYLHFLEKTGCRPYSEAATITVAMIDFAAGTIRFTKHKNVKKGKSRTIYLTPSITEMLQRLALTRKKGLLFVSSRGNAWNSFSVHKLCGRLAKKAGIPKFSAYAFRHARATEALENGLSSDIVGELLGNSPQTINKHYSHLSEKLNTMKEAANKACGS